MYPGVVSLQEDHNTLSGLRDVMVFLTTEEKADPLLLELSLQTIGKHLIKKLSQFIQQAEELSEVLDLPHETMMLKKRNKKAFHL